MGEPAIELHGAEDLMRGTRKVIELEVTSNAPLEVTGIEVQLRGHDGWKHSGELAHRVVHLERVRRLLGPALLHSEPHRFPIHLTLPAAMAPTHAVMPASSALELRVRIGVPRFWRLDIRRQFSLVVREPPPAVLDRTPATARGALHSRSYLEIGLAARQLVAGETLIGSCAAFHVDDSRSQDIVLALVPRLQLFGTHGRVEHREGQSRTLAIPFPIGAAGRSQRFSFPVPRDLTPSFRAETHALSWMFTARLETRAAILGSELPVTVVDALAASRVEPLRVPPMIAGATTGPYR